ncbi:chymotrypsinogen B2-like isoform X2 [Onychostoma macrolepis]|uniref:chymotrypsinogen B2-like isoform X2 n=1 Tax=Onychostoma macrolepis TaxID=369639 RepID=UPI002729998E|nr:chymotrypsinogen B2-like isoform X2 [Onychostoma macrolepis]
MILFQLYTSFPNPRHNDKHACTHAHTHTHTHTHMLTDMNANTGVNQKGLVMLAISSLCQLDVCGRVPVRGRIVGGEDAMAGVWPWQVSIHVIGIGHDCGGTLITKDWVLSAAHCFQRNDESDTVMYFGRRSQSGSNLNEASRRASRIINHPNYGSPPFDNDIALVQLSSSVNFSDYIRPVCLAAVNSTFVTGTESWVTGWGKLQPGATQFPDVLQEVMIPVVSDSDCNKNYGGGFTKNMMCAGLLNEGGKGACQGDSGGPMVSRNGSLWIQSGIVIFGRRCADPTFPTVFARVSQYQDWIKSYMGCNQPGFVEFNNDIQQSTSNSNFRSMPNLLLFPLSLTFSIIPFSLFHAS